MLRRADAEELVSVFYAATVGFCLGSRDGFASEGGVESFANVVGCFGAIGGVGRWDTIDSTRVDNFSIGVDNKDIGSGFCAVFLANIPRGIEENGGGRGPHIFAVSFGLGSSAVALFAWGG